MPFSSPLKARPIGNGYYCLIDGFCYVFYGDEEYFKYKFDCPWIVITIWPDVITDFASVPSFLQKWFPKRGKKVGRAAVLHDVCYQFNLFPRYVCDRLFLRGLAELGMSVWKRWCMYKAVRAFGYWPYRHYTERLKRGLPPLEHYYDYQKPPVEVKGFDSFLDATRYVTEQEYFVSI